MWLMTRKVEKKISGELGQFRVSKWLAIKIRILGSILKGF